ncbi:SET domain-containing protein [Sphingomonas bacterium]|uniref:SET domain-containing protein n=1 Tax=Sphingomonas bacterium TaxID=1895847 RepID=UPI0015757931|nr:SET domain-containing protein [Sphingomonas bacterium]
MTIEPWFIGAVALSLLGYGVYIVGLSRHLVEPNRASWLIWSAATGVEAATYAAVNPGAPQAWVFILSALCCVLVTAAMWRRSRWRTPTPVEGVCMTAALGSIALWLVFREAFWAHMLVVVAVPVSFWPTWQSVWQDRARERSPAWGLWTLADLSTLLVATRVQGSGIAEYTYILVELLCHASVWLMVGLATINPVRSLAFGRGGLRVLDAYLPGNPFAVRETHLGKAVYAAKRFAEGEQIVRFTGRRVRAARLPRSLRGAADRFLQVTTDQYMGPSGRIDDLINHSCAPNAGLRFTDHGVVLIALRAITPGEEIAWDYSTTLKDSGWQMACQCRQPGCRGTVGDFATLPAERQAWFRERDMVAPYLREEMVRERAA